VIFSSFWSYATYEGALDAAGGADGVGVGAGAGVGVAEKPKGDVLCCGGGEEYEDGAAGLSNSPRMSSTALCRDFVDVIIVSSPKILSTAF